MTHPPDCCQGASSFGSATALVAALDPSGEAKLGVANLGDSGLRTAPVGYVADAPGERWRVDVVWSPH